MSLEEAPREVMGGDWGGALGPSYRRIFVIANVGIITPPTNAAVLMTYVAMESSEQPVGVGKVT